ncbi:MAG TPA: hypothetical protein VMF60_01000, partial [Acidimicrobiales bacterium]|nr:hypothetical protein [Acidimicrobiales bacterium]
MTSRTRRGVLALAVSLSATVLWVSGAAYAGGATSYTPGAPALDTVQNGPWTLSQGDPTVGAPYSESWPTYTPGGAPTQPGGFPNLAVYPGPNAPSGTPYASGVAGTPGPVDAYCSGSSTTPETGTQAAEPPGTALPMSPYYFPFVTQTPGDSTQGHLTGYFDYRPKDTEEALVVARSIDGGQSWTYVDKVLEQNPANDCPTGDTNDNGQGHAFVMTVGGHSYLYMLNRPAGDNPGVGLLVDPVSPPATDPVSGLPAVQSVGTDPDTFAADPAPVPVTGGTGATISVTTLGSGAEVVGAGQFEDLDAASPSGSVVTCTGTGANTLTGCTTANGSGLSVASGDPLVQVLGDATGAVTIPQGPNSTLENGGQTIDLSAPLSSITAANVPGRFYVDGATVYCVNNDSATELDNCTATQSGGVSVSVGDAVTTDPILPSSVGQPGGTQQTNGLIAPDGIVGVVPGSVSYPGAPGGSTVVIYGEKILNYFIVGTVASAVSLPAATITITPSTGTSEPIPATGPFTIYLGSTAGSIQAVTCSAYSSGTLSGCSGGTGTVAAGNDVGGPGAAVASSATLSSIGEGSSKPKTLY